MAWTEDKVTMLKELWSKGLSASQIANKMEGVTRNAVIGKVHRLGLSWRAAPTKPQRHVISKKNTEALKTLENNSISTNEFFRIRKAKESLEVKRDENALISLIDLDRSMCKWPIGDPTKEGFHFCGKNAATGKSYCQTHLEVAVYNYQSDKTVEETKEESDVRKKA